MTIDDFRKIDLRVGKIASAGPVPGSEKLLRLEVDLGEKDETGLPTPRQIVAGVGKSYAPAELVGKEVAIVANLEPRKLMGLESNGMLLAAHDVNGNPVVLLAEKDVPPGAIIS